MIKEVKKIIRECSEEFDINFNTIVNYGSLDIDKAPKQICQLFEPKVIDLLKETSILCMCGHDRGCHYFGEGCCNRHLCQCLKFKPKPRNYPYRGFECPTGWCDCPSCKHLEEWLVDGSPVCGYDPFEPKSDESRLLTREEIANHIDIAFPMLRITDERTFVMLEEIAKAQRDLTASIKDAECQEGVAQMLEVIAEHLGFNLVEPEDLPKWWQALKEGVK